jgi:predicted transcriptional regulator
MVTESQTEPQSLEEIQSSAQQLDAQLEQVAERLVDEYADLDEDTVREHVTKERKQFDGAKVHVFVPILVERAVREKLALAHSA